MYDDEENVQRQPRKFKKPRARKVVVPYDPNEELSTEKIEKFRQTLRFSAYWYLERGDKTRKELEDKWRKKVDIPPFIKQEILDELEFKNYLNDKRYAENFVRSRVEYRQLGKSAIRMELIRKGVDSSIIDEVLLDWDEEGEVERARELVLKKMRTSQGVERQKRTQQLVSMLARKGYPLGVGFSIVKELLDAEGLEEEEEILEEPDWDNL